MGKLCTLNANFRKTFFLAMAKRIEKENLSIPEQEPDMLDLEILKLLQENARITVREISEKIHLSTTPVYERIKRMERQNIIQQYTTILNADKVRKGLMVICYVRLKEHSKLSGTKFIKAIQKMNEVIECYNISGQFDFMLKVVSENMNSYYSFHVNKLSEIDNIAHIESTFVMGVLKDTRRLIW